MNTREELERIIIEWWNADEEKVLEYLAQSILDKLPELVEIDVDELGREIYVNGHMGFDEARTIAKVIKQKGIIKGRIK